MKVQTPQISWHSREAVMSVDFQVLRGEVRRVATGGIDTHVVIWYYNLCHKNIVTIDCACDLNRHNKSVNALRFSPNGEYLASGDVEGAIIIWRLKEKMLPELDGEEDCGNKEDWGVFKILRGHIDDVNDLSWSPDSDFLMSGSVDNCTIIWDIQKGQNIRISKEAKSYVQGVAWDPLNQYQVTISSDRMLRIYNGASGKVVHRIHKAFWVETIDKSSKKTAKLFHDDTLKSYCRRLKFTPDGELLFVPSGIREKGDDFIHTTYVFSRHDFTRPILNLPTGQKSTSIVTCCPQLFKLQGDVENSKQKPMINLPYRLLIAVATQDSILMYDTEQLLPFSYISNIHYRQLTDMAWSPDGRMLLVSSADGYCSFIIFSAGELGEIYIPEKKESPLSMAPSITSTPNQKSSKKIIDSLSPPERMNTDVQEVPTPGEKSRKSPNPSKVITPKRTPISVKKSPSSISIKRFFSAPGKSKVRLIENSDDCMIIDEKLVTTDVDKSEDIPTVIVSDADKDAFKTPTPQMESSSGKDNSSSGGAILETQKITNENFNQKPISAFYKLVSTTNDKMKSSDSVKDTHTILPEEPSLPNNSTGIIHPPSAVGTMNNNVKGIEQELTIAGSQSVAVDVVTSELPQTPKTDSVCADSVNTSASVSDVPISTSSVPVSTTSDHASVTSVSVTSNSSNLASISASSSNLSRDTDVVMIDLTDSDSKLESTPSTLHGISNCISTSSEVILNNEQITSTKLDISKVSSEKPKKRIQFVTLSSKAFSK